MAQLLAKILVHTVFPTKDRRPFLRDEPLREELHRTLGGILTNLGCQPHIIGGVDAMAPAVQAVLDGTMLATVRNPSCRIHGWSVAAGVAAVQGGEKAGKDIPNYILADGPVITKETAPGHLWLQKNFLI